MKLTEALRYFPFDGDFGNVGDRILRDKIVRFRKAGPCHICGVDVEPGTEGRSLTMLWVDDGVMTYRYCTPCTQAMADNWSDDGKSLDARFAHRSALEQSGEK